MNTALAEVSQAPHWTRERIELLKKTIIPQGCGDDDFALFLEQCRRTGLDPLLKQAFMVERQMKVGFGRDEKWVTKYEFQAAEAGMAARADLFPDYRGMKAAAVYDGDVVEVDEEAGTVRHTYNPAKRGTKLIGAWAHAYREGRHLPITWLPVESRIQRKKDGAPTKFWATMPAGMIVKCARAEQFRIAYPNIFGGVYIQEEMPEEERERPAKKEKVREVDAVPNKDAPALPLPTEVEFGELKGKPIATLHDEELSTLAINAQESLDKHPGAKWAPRMRRNLEALQAEIERRIAEERAQADAQSFSVPLPVEGDQEVPF